MSAGSSLALALIRVPHGNPRPSDEECRTALVRDREELRRSGLNGAPEFDLAGPYHIIVDGNDVDEWVVWEK